MGGGVGTGVEVEVNLASAEGVSRYIYLVGSGGMLPQEKF